MVEEIVWSKEQLKYLRSLEAAFPSGTLHLIPVSKGSKDEGYGSTIQWDARIFSKAMGVMGPLPVTMKTLERIGCPDPEGWCKKVEDALKLLHQMYPTLEPAIERRVRELKEAAPECFLLPRKKLKNRVVRWEG